MLYIFVIAYSLCAVSCQKCEYRINNNYLEGNCSLVNGVGITKLKDVVVKNEVPDEFNKDVDAHFGAFSDKEFSYFIKNPFYKIHFNKKLAGYSWTSFYNDAVYDTLPFLFEKNTWYLVDNLYEGGVPSVRLFVYVNKDGSFITLREDAKTNF